MIAFKCALLHKRVYLHVSCKLYTCVKNLRMRIWVMFGKSLYGRIIISRGRIIIPLRTEYQIRSLGILRRVHILILSAPGILFRPHGILFRAHELLLRMLGFLFFVRKDYMYIYWNCISCSKKSMMCSRFNILCERVTIPYALNLISCVRIINYYSIRSTSYL